MKILCICEWGNSRSVALAFMLKEKGHDAIAIGMKPTSPETKEMLIKWADKVILVDKSFEEELPPTAKEKLYLYDVGGDRFFRGFEPELLQMYENYLRWKPL